MESQERTTTASRGDLDVIIIGAGFGGLRALYEMRRLGLSTKVLEAGDDVGGTWYWNRYPGARTDTEAWAYCYSFSKDLQDEWDWPERMPTWSHVLGYLRHVASRFDMRRDIELRSRVRAAHYGEARRRWTVTTEDGRSYSATYLVSASGLLSVACAPPFPGLARFAGETYVSSAWPKEPVSFCGKRVGIVGAGATAVQILPIVAQEAAHVSFFQRTPNYVLPGRNHPLDDVQRGAIRRQYDDIWKLVRRQVFAFPMEPANRLFDDFTPEEQARIFEAGWETGGFRFLFETFDDLITNERANAAASEFLRRKIRAIVKDPATAEILCPKYPFAVKRPPLGNFYYEAFNRPNVTLVDLSRQPIEEITRRGLRVGDREHEVDAIIFALGFDAATGALTAMDVRGKGGQTVKAKWEAGPRTHLGITIDGFPNLFMLSGPHSPFANIPPVIEAAVTWIGRAIDHARRRGCDSIEPTPTAVESWTRHVRELLDLTLLGQGERVHTWFLGANVPGKARSPLFYFGGAGAYFDELARSADAGFADFAISGA